MGIFTKNINPMAYGTRLVCPHPKKDNWNEKCNSERWKKDEQGSTPFRIRYICKECGKPVLYDISNNINPELLRVRK